VESGGTFSIKAAMNARYTFSRDDIFEISITIRRDAWSRFALL